MKDSSNFYNFVSCEANNGYQECPWAIKRVNSTAGPNEDEGTTLSEAIRSPDSVPGETVVLWRDPDLKAGWQHKTSYKYQIVHLPDANLIRLKVWENGVLIVDSGDIIDDSEDSLKGGKLGVFCDSQEKVRWSALSYKCL